LFSVLLDKSIDYIPLFSLVFPCPKIINVTLINKTGETLQVPFLIGLWKHVLVKTQNRNGAGMAQYSNSLQAELSRDRMPVEARFSAPF
jgi:hypothetical protein